MSFFSSYERFGRFNCCSFSGRELREVEKYSRESQIHHQTLHHDREQQLQQRLREQREREPRQQELLYHEQQQQQMQQKIRENDRIRDQGKQRDQLQPRLMMTTSQRENHLQQSSHFHHQPASLQSQQQSQRDIESHLYPRPPSASSSSRLPTDSHLRTSQLSVSYPNHRPSIVVDQSYDGNRIMQSTVSTSSTKSESG